MSFFVFCVALVGFSAAEFYIIFYGIACDRVRRKLSDQHVVQSEILECMHESMRPFEEAKIAAIAALQDDMG